MRTTVCLNGEWDFMPLYGVKHCLDLPKELAFEPEKICVPSSWRYMVPAEEQGVKRGFGIVDGFEPFNTFDYPAEWSKADTAVYHRTFRVPDEMAGGRIFLKFNGVLQTSRVFVNGREAATWEEAYLPLNIDITDLVYTDGGENDLLVVVSTFEQDVIPSGLTKSLGLTGSWFGAIGRGIWEDVYLEGCPLTYVNDIHVKTSWREAKIEISVSVANWCGDSRPLDVKATVLDGGMPVKTLGRAEIMSPADNEASVCITEDWPDAHHWMPDDPHLYELQVELYDHDRQIDSQTIKFGFREVWSEGHRLLINGVRVNLRGDSWHFQGATQQSRQYALNWFRLCKDYGFNYVRLHAQPYPEYYLDAADECGMLVVDETAIYGSGKAIDAGNPLYLERCKRHAERLVLRDRNHPSVILWSLENEMRWVDGRDVYKLQIPEMMRRIHALDGTRPIILEGDNRLLAKDKSEIESYHYNIDGTMAQWDRSRPLIFGEHGGWWYACPQNSSAYIGSEAYESIDGTLKGLALKERLYVEYCRRVEVTGITSFNLVHYMQRSMPAEDVRLKWDDLNAPGCKPKVIRKYSMTINNGMLENYPLCTPNVSLEVLRDCYKPVTILPDEYDSAFFDGAEVRRSFSIYNDTLHAHHSRVELWLRRSGGEVVQAESYSLRQEPGERQRLEVALQPFTVSEPEEVVLEMSLYHEETLVHRLEKRYRFFPARLKTQALDTLCKKAAFWGNDDSFCVISALLPSCLRLNSLAEIATSQADLLIIGSHMDANAGDCMQELGEFVEAGGTVVQLEQNTFMPGSLNLCRQPFFSAHINDNSHPMLLGFTDDDFRFWKAGTNEETPLGIMEAAITKPVRGDATLLLECSAGDFGDGGDLWAALVEYRVNKGTIIINQLELIDNWENVPQACLLLRNILQYAISLQPRKPVQTGLLTHDRSIIAFMERIGVVFDLLDAKTDPGRYGLIAADAKGMDESTAEALSAYAADGGKLMILPAGTNEEETVRRLLGCGVRIENKPAWVVKRTEGGGFASGISLTDTFGFDKVTLTPRRVENTPACLNSIDVEGGANLMMSVTGQPWYDYYVREFSEEFSRPALIEFNRERKEAPLPYLVEKRLGKGVAVLSQLETGESDKSVRIYTRLLSNLGAQISSDLFTCQKSDGDYAVNCFMTLPHEAHNDLEKERAYYTDPAYSLNNLGEGLYGWMKKVEKDAGDGFISIPADAGKRYFLTCFVYDCLPGRADAWQAEALSYRLAVDANCSVKIWMNGNPVLECSQASPDVRKVSAEVLLRKGYNRIAVETVASGGGIRFRPVFRNMDGSYAANLNYRLTIDEVDPK